VGSVVVERQINGGDNEVRGRITDCQGGTVLARLEGSREATVVRQRDGQSRGMTDGEKGEKSTSDAEAVPIGHIGHGHETHDDRVAHSATT
jgi:hypothetical protein